MSILYLLGIGIRKQADPINSLGFAMLVLTVPNPFAAGDTGLLLSFSATLGILLFSGRIQARLNRWTESIGVLKRLFRGLNSTIAATVSATVFTSPIVALTFGELSLVAPLSNLLMEFPADIMLLCGFLTSIFYYIPVINFLAMPFGLGAGIAANYLMECAAWLANLPMASIPVTQEVLLICSRSAADIADSVCRSVCGDCDDPLGRISSSAHGLHHRISAGFHGSGRRL